MDRHLTRSPLARAIGLGSAKTGFEHLWAERVSAVAFVPLTLWFAASLIAHAGGDYAAFRARLANPLVAVLMILLLVALFHHTALRPGPRRHPVPHPVLCGRGSRTEREIGIVGNAIVNLVIPILSSASKNSPTAHWERDQIAAALRHGPHAIDQGRLSALVERAHPRIS